MLLRFNECGSFRDGLQREETARLRMCLPVHTQNYLCQLLCKAPNAEYLNRQGKGPVITIFNSQCGRIGRC